MSSSQGFPLSAEQRRVWAVQGPASVLRVQCALIVEGALDPPRLRTGAEELVAAHEILRTTYRRPPGHKAPLQVIAEGLGVAWRVEDASGGDDAPARAAQSAARVLREEAEASFDLEAGPILRMAVARIAASSVKPSTGNISGMKSNGRMK